jgi:myo-inositol 2-dehydrogenase/D-chiro-inositol 1-dehydrogenase
MSQPSPAKKAKINPGAHLQEPVGIALVGMGRIGKVHFKNIISNTRSKLKWIVDVDLKAAQEAVQGLSDIKLTTNLDEALKDPAVQGVVVCTPTSEHKETILKSLRSGKPIMCEKPISLSLNETDECYNESKKLGVPLLCGYQRRSDPTFSSLQEHCKKGSIGKLQVIKTTSRDNPVPTLAYLKISGKIFHDCGSHDFDLCRWISGEDPIEVHSYATAFNPDIKALHDWDTVVVHMKFPSGALAMVDLSRKATYGYDQRIEVLGDKGMIQSNNQQRTSNLIHLENGISSDPNLYSFQQRYEKAYSLEFDHFVDVIVGKAEPRLTHDDVRKVTLIADAAERSAELGKPVLVKYD